MEMIENPSAGTLELYNAFRNYPLKSKIDGCPHCISDEAESFLHAHSLYTMTWDDFGKYPSKAMTTFGDLEDFKHFLPRLFELYRNDYEASHYDVFFIFSKLDYAAWKTWPKSEIRSINNFVNEWILEINEEYSQEDSWIAEQLFKIFSEYKFI